MTDSLDQQVLELRNTYMDIIVFTRFYMLFILSIIIITNDKWYLIDSRYC